MPPDGCNCGRSRPPRTTTPLLTDDLVIASRARAREPELPAATVAHALATPVPTKLARYDAIVLSAAPDQIERDTRIAAEFARHDHRVFHFGAQRNRRQRPAAPNLQRLPMPSRDDALLETLAALRDAEGIEAAMLFAPDTLDAGIAGEVRRRWGWRLVVSTGAPVALRDRADVLLAAEKFEFATINEQTVVFLPEMSWPERWAVLDRAFRATWPRASIVVITWDNLAFSRLCLASILQNTEYPNYEIIVVDNASTDGTVAELRRLATEAPHLRPIFNPHNAGFGPANNQGLAAATGEILVLLNNDTVVPHGWLTRLARHLEDPAVGLIGPATNRTCNEAQLDIPYQTYGEFRHIARTQGKKSKGQRHPIRMPMMFCLAFRRDTYERLGPLDEQYEVGMFEDEDYALRAKAAGLDVVWTPEVYIHHAYHASIGKLLPTGEYMRLVRLNQGRFEEKWGICWERHRPAPAPAA
ncbi:MAG: glycosyltransferase family 2 protein [Chloroflexota bacterium]|nr:glycosyltransferase family 2 protein [Chloroflexota bacterium]